MGLKRCGYLFISFTFLCFVRYFKLIILLNFPKDKPKAPDHGSGAFKKIVYTPKCSLLNLSISSAMIGSTCANMLEEPEAMLELAEVIGEYRFKYAKLLVDYMKPDIILSHDDWGNKTNLFMSPGTWRTIIKPQFVKMYKYIKDNGVLIMHHADSYLEPIVEDMVELGIDIWQGVLPTNNIQKIQKQLGGRMTLMGGIDSVIDRADTPEDE
jgi:uroporphyrinogen-III decarboxylase